MKDVVTPEVWLRDRPWLDNDHVDIDGYVARLTKLPNYDLAAKLKHWHEKGFVVFEQAISRDLIQEFMHDIGHLIANYQEYEVPIEIRGQQISNRDTDAFPVDMTGVKLNQMHCFSKAAARLSLSSNIADFLSHVFQNPASVCQSLTFWRGSEQPIHIDYPYVRQQTKLAYLAASWIPLEDVSPDAGPLAYYPGGHRVWNSGFFDWGNGSIVYDEHSSQTPTDFARYLYGKMNEAGIKPTVFCPRMGDVLIWHGNLPHEGTQVNQPTLTRKSYVTHYTAEATLPDWMRHHDANGAPVGEFENGAYSWRYRWFEGTKMLPGAKQKA